MVVLQEYWLMNENLKLRTMGVDKTLITQQHYPLKTDLLKIVFIIMSHLLTHKKNVFSTSALTGDTKSTSIGGQHKDVR